MSLAKLTTKSLQLRFLGTSDAKGVPRWWCMCSICKEARTTGQNRRSRASVLLTYSDSATKQSEQVLIDAAPELRLQLDSLENKHVDNVLISHAHNDHVSGLPDIAMWAYDCAKKHAKNYADDGFVCPLYSPKEVIDILEARFSFLKNKTYFPFRDITLLDKPLAGYKVEAIKVPHGFNGYSYAFLFTSVETGKRWAHMSDCIGLKELEPWYDLDLLIIGASFYKETQPLEGRSVYDVLEATQLSQKLRARQTILTHLSHDVDLRKEAPSSVSYAYDGLVLDLPS